MPWNEPGGNQQDPWTGKKRGSDNDPEELIRKLNEKLGSLFGSGRGGDSNGGKGILLLAMLGLVIWALSGIYTIDARQQGLVLRFGAYQETTGAGLHWHLPYPIETLETVDVEKNRSNEDRSSMLTKDENIVEIGVSVQYKISNVQDYSFNIKDVDSDDQGGTLSQVMRSATREVIGRNDMDFILKDGREQIAIDTKALMQKILDSYKAGLQIIKVNLAYAEAPKDVKAAFDDANKARENANQFKNEAETYSNKVIPDARGKAARLIEEANAKRQEAIDKAEGDAARFDQLVAAYHQAPEITRERLYLDTMENVMSGSRKVIVDAKNGNNLLYIPLNAENGQPAKLDPAAVEAAAKTLQTATPPATGAKDPNNVRSNDVRDATRDATREGR
jgi:membrane protease subunit HflK